jgi:hypothetical protein
MSVEFQSGFDELMKARRASVGEIRVHSNGVKYQKQPDGSWRVAKGQKVGKEQYSQDELKVFGKNHSNLQVSLKKLLIFF